MREGSSVVVKVILSADPERSVTVPISRTNQGGASNGDYSGVGANTSVTFNSGDTEESITFAATDDSVDDDDESVLLGFGTLPAGVSAGSPATATVNITDDDVPAVTVRYEQSSYTVAEGSSVVVKVILSADPERSVTSSDQQDQPGRGKQRRLFGCRGQHECNVQQRRHRREHYVCGDRRQCGR